MTAPLRPDEVKELTAGLHKLARNLWWTWNQEAQELFQEMSPRGWQNLFHNGVAILHEVSDYELKVRLQEPDFADRVRRGPLPAETGIFGLRAELPCREQHRVAPFGEQRGGVFVQSR